MNALQNAIVRAMIKIKQSCIKMYYVYLMRIK